MVIELFEMLQTALLIKMDGRGNEFLNLKMPKKAIVNENGKYSSDMFMLHLILINGVSLSEELVISNNYIKKVSGMKDNRTIKKCLSNLKDIEVMKSYELHLNGDIDINDMEIYSDDELFEVDIKVSLYEKNLVRLIFYLSYYRYLQLKNPNEAYYKYVMKKTIGNRLQISNFTITKIFKELRDSEHKQLEDDNIFVKDGEINLIENRIDEKPETKEKQLENFLVDNIEYIEKGMSVVGNQVKVKYGQIDIHTIDANGVDCIIELKAINNDKRLAYQCRYYPTQINKPTRMIVVAPDYREDTITSLKGTNTELYIYEELSNEYLIRYYQTV